MTRQAGRRSEDTFSLSSTLGRVHECDGLGRLHSDACAASPSIYFVHDHRFLLVCPLKTVVSKMDAVVFHFRSPSQGPPLDTTWLDTSSPKVE
jgi:hypothetical protein